MKRLLLLLPLLLACNPAPQETVDPIDYSPEPAEEITDWDKLILAMCLTESEFRPDAVGTQGDLGLLQIRAIYVEEVNRVSGTHYIHEDAFDIDKSLEMFSLMQEHYNPGHDIEVALRYHNKAAWYRRRVLDNLEFINRYEEVRNKLILR